MGTLRPPQKQIAKSRARVKAKKQFTQRRRRICEKDDEDDEANFTASTSPPKRCLWPNYSQDISQ
jgi:hypothetical protein